jgi:hypothetical protein
VAAKHVLLAEVMEVGGHDRVTADLAEPRLIGQAVDAA